MNEGKHDLSNSGWLVQLINENEVNNNNNNKNTKKHLKKHFAIRGYLERWMSRTDLAIK